MRHSRYGRKLGRNRNQRDTLFKSLISSLILSGRIQTTEAKAKAIKGLADRLINHAKSPNTRRLVCQFLIHKQISDKLFDEIVPKMQSRGSGYTSIVKLGYRKGDASRMVQMSLLFDEGTNQKITDVKSEKGKVLPKLQEQQQ